MSRASPGVAARPATVAVVSWNTRELLAACLASLAGEQSAGRADVWVVDNASSDGSADMVAGDFTWARLIRADENLGFGRAVNLVADRTDTPWLVAANADVEVTPGALEALLETGARHPEAGAVAPRLVLPDGSTQHSVYSFPTVRFAALFNAGVGRLSRRAADRLCLEGRWDPSRPREVDWAVGAFLLLRRTAFDEVGGFDRRQWMYAEDLDLGWRLRRAGWTVRYEPRAAVRHAGSAAAAQAFGDERTARWMAATYAWLVRRRGAAVARMVAAINLAGAGLRLAALLPLTAIAPERHGWRRRQALAWVRIHGRGLRAPAAPS